MTLPALLRRRVVLPALMSLALGASAHAQAKPDFANHAFFKLLIGEWTSEGELKGADGNVITIKEEWKGGVSGEGAFLMEGRRTLNKDQHDYRWIISATTTGGLYEVAHHTSNDGGNTQRFEASVSEVELTMELTAPFGDGNLKIQDSLSAKDRDTFVSKVTLTDASGKATLTGTITHKRVKKP